MKRRANRNVSQIVTESFREFCNSLKITEQDGTSFLVEFFKDTRHDPEIESVLAHVAGCNAEAVRDGFDRLSTNYGGRSGLMALLGSDPVNCRMDRRNRVTKALE